MKYHLCEQCRSINIHARGLAEHSDLIRILRGSMNNVSVYRCESCGFMWDYASEQAGIEPGWQPSHLYQHPLFA